MDDQGLFNFAVWKFLDVVKEFLIFFALIFLGEWFAEIKGYNVIERAWLITVIALSVLTFAIWAHWGYMLNFL